MTNTIITLFWVYYLKDSSPLPLLSPFWGEADLQNVAYGMWVVSRSEDSHPSRHSGAMWPGSATTPLEKILCLWNKEQLGFVEAQTKDWIIGNGVILSLRGHVVLLNWPLFFFSLLLLLHCTYGPWMANPYSCSLGPQYLLVHNHKWEFPINPAHWARPHSPWSLARKIISCLWVGCSSQVHWWLPCALTSPAPFPQAGDCG